MNADLAFHRSIAEATGNPHFLALVEFLFNCLKTATATTRSYEATKATLSREIKDMEGATRRLSAVAAEAA